jgi:hypothetical protein
LYSGKQSTQRRNENIHRQPLEFALNIDDIMQLLSAQGGRCALSGMPLEFKPNMQFSASLDRVDVNLGYTKGNIRLVAVILNATDNSVRMRTQTDTSHNQWSSEKYEHFIECARKKFNM